MSRKLTSQSPLDRVSPSDRHHGGRGVFGILSSFLRGPLGVPIESRLPMARYNARKASEIATLQVARIGFSTPLSGAQLGLGRFRAGGSRSVSDHTTAGGAPDGS